MKPAKVWLFIVAAIMGGMIMASGGTHHFIIGLLQMLFCSAVLALYLTKK